MGSSIAALFSVLILESVLANQGIIKLTSPLNRFNLSLFISCVVLSVFLYLFNQYFHFMNLGALMRVLLLFVEVTAAVLIYFACIKILLGNEFKKLLSE